MICKLVNILEQGAIVSWEDDGMLQAVVISIDNLPEEITDGVLDLDEEVVANGISYGLTLEDLTKIIGTENLLNVFRRNGLWTKDDIILYNFELANRLAIANLSKSLRRTLEARI